MRYVTLLVVFCGATNCARRQHGREANGSTAIERKDAEPISLRAGNFSMEELVGVVVGCFVRNLDSLLGSSNIDVVGSQSNEGCELGVGAVVGRNKLFVEVRREPVPDGQATI